MESLILAACFLGAVLVVALLTAIWRACVPLGKRLAGNHVLAAISMFLPLVMWLPVIYYYEHQEAADDMSRTTGITLIIASFLICLVGNDVSYTRYKQNKLFAIPLGVGLMSGALYIGLLIYMWALSGY